jgi:hypothetical protein
MFGHSCWIRYGKEQEAYLPTATDIDTDRKGRVVRNNPGKQDFADLDPIEKRVSG